MDEKDKIDWTLCVLCQEKRAEKLQCPARSDRSDKGAGYRYVADVINGYKGLDCDMPITLKAELLNSDEGMADMLLEHEACWHK